MIYTKNYLVAKQHSQALEDRRELRLGEVTDRSASLFSLPQEVAPVTHHSIYPLSYLFTITVALIKMAAYGLLSQPEEGQLSTSLHLSKLKLTLSQMRSINRVFSTSKKNPLSGFPSVS